MNTTTNTSRRYHVKAHAFSRKQQRALVRSTKQARKQRNRQLDNWVPGLVL